jgi:hypothetical protein
VRTGTVFWIKSMTKPDGNRDCERTASEILDRAWPADAPQGAEGRKQFARFAATPPNRLHHALRLTLVAAVAVQLFAFGETLMVCRYSGRVLQKCCPAAPTTDKQEWLMPTCCCDLVHLQEAQISEQAGSTRPDVRGLYVALPSNGPVIVSTVPQQHQTLFTRATGPPSQADRYVRVRHLLI